MDKYTQLTINEREKLACLWVSTFSIMEIVRKMGRNKSTISRELGRNAAPPGQYWPDTAQRKSRARRKRGCIIDKNEKLHTFLVDQLQCHKWMPDQMNGHLKYRQKDLPSVSHETIYKWLYQKPQKAEKLWKYLERHKAKRGLRKSRGAGAIRIPNRVSIHERPSVGGSKRKKFGTGREIW